VTGTCGYGEGFSGSIIAGSFLTSLLVSFPRRTLLHGVSKYMHIFGLLQYTFSVLCNKSHNVTFLSRYVMITSRYE
jgi:hypothetical protein